MEIKTFDQLEYELENWTNFSGEGQYDFVGALHLLAALCRNIERNTVDDDFEILVDFFQKDEQKILTSIASKIKQ